MLIQILTHTPLYVWAILAFLIYRGLVAMRALGDSASAREEINNRGP